MSNVGSSQKTGQTKVFETILSSPGMSDSCKVTLKMTRQNVLLLSRLIETGILNPRNNFEDEILGSLPEESAADFKVIHEEILKKAGLTEFYEKLKSL